MSTTWTSKNIPSQSGRRIIVTGANSGIGWHTALELARAGGEVTVTARSKSKCEDAANRIRAIVPNANLQTGVLDLTDPESIRVFAAKQMSRPLDVLINNAGVMALPQRQLSVDGHEVQFATNVLGPYRLTGLLLPALLRGAAPRVVTVASNTHKAGGPVPLEDLDSKNGYAPIRVYSKTKLANILFTRELQRRAGDRLLAVCCHPGASRTNLAMASSIAMKVAAVLFLPLMQSAAMGAEPTLMVTTAENVEPGSYFGPGGFMELRGPAVKVQPAPFATDAGAARMLFDELEHITGSKYAF